MITGDLKGKPHNAKKQVSFSSLPYRPIFVTLLIRSTMEMAHTKRVLLSPKIFMNWLPSNFCVCLARLHKNAAGIFWCLLVRREVNPKVMIIIIFIVFHATIYAATSSICQQRETPFWSSFSRCHDLFERVTTEKSLLSLSSPLTVSLVLNVRLQLLLLPTQNIMIIMTKEKRAKTHFIKMRRLAPSFIIIRAINSK